MVINVKQIAGATGCTGSPCAVSADVDRQEIETSDEEEGANTAKAVFVESNMDCPCTMEYEPVCCGTDTYGNQCEEYVFLCLDYDHDTNLIKYP